MASDCSTVFLLKSGLHYCGFIKTKKMEKLRNTRVWSCDAIGIAWYSNVISAFAKTLW